MSRRSPAALGRSPIGALIVARKRTRYRASMRRCVAALLQRLARESYRRFEEFLDRHQVMLRRVSGRQLGEAGWQAEQSHWKRERKALPEIAAGTG